MPYIKIINNVNEIKYDTIFSIFPTNMTTVDINYSAKMFSADMQCCNDTVSLFLIHKIEIINTLYE